MADGGFYHSGKHPHVRGKAMLISFFSLFILLLLLLFLVVYARCVLGRRARRRALIHHLNTPADAAQIHIHEPPKRGLDSSVIAALPTFIYKKTDARGAECAVCLSVLEEEEMARILPNCKHVFHAQCIDVWLQSHCTCPICRTVVVPQAPESAELAAFPASAPPLDRSVSMGLEGTSDAVEQTSKEGGSFSRLSSFRRILNRERAEWRRADEGDDLER